MEERGSTAWLLLATPSVALLMLWLTSPGLRDLIGLASWGVFAYWGSGLLAGWLMFRRGRSVHDQEWHRSRSIRRLEKTYRSEDKGLWLQADSADQRLEVRAEDGLAKKAEMRLQGRVHDINRESGPTEIEAKEDDSLEVELFMEQEHVIRSTDRVTGKSGPVESVTGVTVQPQQSEAGNLVGKALGRLRQAREGAVDRAVAKQRRAPVAESSAGRSGLGLAGSEEQVAAGPAVHVLPGQDYDPSPAGTAIGSEWSDAGRPSATAAEPPAASKKCSDCAAAMAIDEAYCPRCGAFAA